MPALRIIVTGHVQGVFFRATARMQADTLHIKGMVRNLPDGSVEIFAEGSQKSLDAFLQWCHRGPPAARVENVIARKTKEEGRTMFVSERS